jgi:hypothetical protein
MKIVKEEENHFLPNFKLSHNHLKEPSPIKEGTLPKVPCNP